MECRRQILDLQAGQEANSACGGGDGASCVALREILASSLTIVRTGSIGLRSRRPMGGRGSDPD